MKIREQSLEDLLMKKLRIHIRKYNAGLLTFEEMTYKMRFEFDNYLDILLDELKKQLRGRRK